MSIKKKCLLASLALLLLLLCNPHPSRAQGPSGDTLTQMQNEGWKIIQDGVLQRELRAGEVESFVFGVPGFVWKLQDLQKQLGNLQKVYRAHPTPELRRAIVSHRKEIANTRKALAQARLGEASGESNIEKVSCNINFAYDASASYGTSAQGTWGKASANFSSNCAFSGEVYAYAYATATATVDGGPVTMTVTDGPRSGASVSASVTATQDGVPSCYSEGYASMTSYSLNPSSYIMQATNESCPVVVTPLNASITSNAPSTIIDLYNSDCTTITWTTSASGGTAPYTSTMSVNGVSQGTRTTYSGSYCNAGTNTSSTVAVSSTVTDSGSPAQSKSVSAPTITIRSHVVPPPLSVSVTSNAPSTIIDLYNSDCTTIAWTTGISGGTSPYTSTMYLNGVSQGARTTYSGTWCNAGTTSSTTLAVSSTVTDSGSPVQSKSVSAPTITVRSHPVTPLSVTVTSNAPSTLIDLYDSDCVTITWTTNISGGAPSYSSTMYLNSASQGARTTFTGTYCNAGTASSRTLAVSATVTDSSSPVQSKSASAPTITVRSHAVFTGGCYTVTPDGKISTNPCP